MNPVELVLSRRLRVTPFEARVREQGVKSYTVYNHMVLPVNFSNTLEEYQHLCEHVQLWDVAAERQVEVVGPDALELVELITPRHIAPCEVGQCVYAPLADEDALVVNDPIILRLAEDRFWISIADSDVLLWVKGIAWGRGLNVRVFEPDVSPLAVQGPKADDVMADLLGESVRDIKFFRFIETTIANTNVVLARSGWSGQGGFEIYLQNSADGLALWDAVWEAGRKYHIRSGAPNLIERLETGLKSYGSDMTHEDSVLECAFERYLNLDKPAPYMAQEAIEKQLAQGVPRRLCNVMVESGPLPGLRGQWELVNEQQQVVGLASSCAYSPKYQASLLFAMLSQEVSTPSTQLTLMVDGVAYPAVVKDDRWKS
ncbi:MAG: dimethylsulfoniopropionate demethylase [Pseudomonadota bacterium]